MIVQIVPKREWSQVQKEQVHYYRTDPAHADDSGPIKVDYASGMYAAAFESGEIFGIIEASGPPDAVDPGWWIAQKYRGQGLGTPMVISLAKRLRQEGYTGIGRILIQTTRNEYDAASSRLKEVFIDAFCHESERT